jgi:hypothetical protein
MSHPRCASRRWRVALACVPAAQLGVHGVAEEDLEDMQALVHHA